MATKPLNADVRSTGSEEPSKGDCAVPPLAFRLATNAGAQAEGGKSY